MSLWKIAWRSIQQRALASSLTALSMALGVALVVSVLVLYGVMRRSFTQGAEGFDIIIGAKGSKLQLVLNTVFHLSSPVENIPWPYYKEFLPGGKYGDYVRTAIPYCLGDNYEGFRVVGTTPQLFEVGYTDKKNYEFAAGRNFEDDHYFEAVIGALAARETGLRVGSEFQPTHGVSGEDGHKHDAFKVVGILKPTGTPNDRALFVNMEGFFLLAGHAKGPTTPEKGHHHDEDEHGKHDHEGHEHEKHEADKAKMGDAAAKEKAVGNHDHDEAKAPATKTVEKHADKDDHDHDAEHAAKGAPAAMKEHDHEHEHGHDHAHGHDHDHGHDHHHEPLPESQREVTAILVRFHDPIAGPGITRIINKGNVAQAVAPISEVYTLFEGIVGNLEKLLLVLAGLIVVVSGIGVMVSIYNSMSDRRREIAIMRSLGAGRQTVLAVVLLEAILLALGGGLVGWVLGHGLLAALSPVIVAQTGISVGMFQFDPYEVRLIPGLIVLAALAGYLPALAAYRTDVAKALSAAP